MHTYPTQLFIVAGIHLLAVISPGPDFLLVSKYSISKSRKLGIAAAIGLSLGIAVHVTYSILGIAALVAHSILLFNVIRIIGALYLIYIGVMSFRVSNNKVSNKVPKLEPQKDLTDSIKSAIKTGFLTNVLNPKATLFFLALFTQVITPSTPKWIQACYGVEIMIATGIWFSIVAICFSAGVLARKIESWKGVIDKVTGVVLAGLGFKILLE